MHILTSFIILPNALKGPVVVTNTYFLELRRRYMYQGSSNTYFIMKFALTPEEEEGLPRLLLTL